jgi:FK506-binding protein 4/5
MGKTPEEQQAIKQIKLNTYLNIAACNIKNKSYTEAVLACEEALKIDPKNLRALYRRARATSLPINAGVPELRKAMNDLD